MKQSWIYQTVMLVLFSMTVFVLSSCSSDDDIEDGGSIKNATALLIGEWHCTSQKWFEYESGDTESSEYEPSSEYSMEFDETGYGYMISGRDQLFEIMTRGMSFEWSVINKKGRNYVVTDIYDYEEYRIDKLTASSLEMTWDDGYNRISCTFVKVP